MIFDVNVSLGVWPFRPLRFTTPAGLFQHLAEYGITAGLVRSAAAPFTADLDAANVQLSQVCRGTDFIPVPAVRPEYGNWRALLGGPAVALYPTFHNFSLSAPATLEMAATLAASGTALVIILREEDERGQHPHCRIPSLPAREPDEFARRLPPATVMVLNGYLPEIVQWTAPNLYSDFAFAEAFPSLPTLLKGFPAERLLFGSHSPFFYTSAAIAKLAGAELDHKTIEKIQADNLKGIIYG